MINSISFQTRARTIDHLGREQIADCPTAISELWKNSFDAYARKVELNIFDGDVPICSLVDNGHGMSRLEFEEKWLTVGTESKITGSPTTESDRNGLPVRPKQGQKGIGRLSCAALGSVLLLVSKRKNSSFVAALVDWRLFENPFLMLQDISFPVIDFDDKETLLELLPDMQEKLLSNIWGDGSDLVRDQRLKSAWESFNIQQENDGIELTSHLIESTKIAEHIDIKHLSTWEVWDSISDCGTSMFILGLHDDLKAQLSTDSIEDMDGPERRARESFLQTLSNFTDPFIKDEENSVGEFTNAIYAWNGKFCREIISDVKEFDISNIEELEHIVEGDIDEEGYFKGRVKAFGNWNEGVLIKPKVKYKTRKDSRFGSFSVRIASYEGISSKTSLPENLHAFYIEQSRWYTGLMLYRDGLRVMPYGREDNDYFEIEKRRSKNAGRYFWSNRRTFGRISISRSVNPNLKDKAGREGLIENRASKLFREIVEHILIEVADKYLGSKSESRSVALKDIAEEKNRLKAEADRKNLLKKQRRRIKSAINQNQEKLSQLVDQLNRFADEVKSGEPLENEQAATLTKEKIGQFISELDGYSLSPLPSSLGSVADAYKDYRRLELRARDITRQLDESVNKALSQLIKKSDYEVAMSVFKSKASQLQAAIRVLAKEGRDILANEQASFNLLVEERNRSYSLAMGEILEDLKLEKLSIETVLEALDNEYTRLHIENIQKLKPYVTALKSLKDQIDLEGLAIHSINEMERWKEEAGRLHQLAQLGITVEVIGHEIEGLDMTIGRGLKTIEHAEFNAQQRNAYINVLRAHESLSDKWRFLSPLKLSGDKTKIKITGQTIFDYVMDYFSDSFSRKDISFLASESFKKISLKEQPARLYPVFINLVNNARYWVAVSTGVEKKILLDFDGENVVVADNGPGVDTEDLDQLFTLFFTRKQRGGRGVGLYLCKQNLMMGSHTIRYETDDSNKVLPGANFMIGLKGVVSV